MGVLGADASLCQVGQNLATLCSTPRRGGNILIGREAHGFEHTRQARLHRRIGDAKHILDILDDPPATQKCLDEFELRRIKPCQPPKPRLISP